VRRSSTPAAWHGSATAKVIGGQAGAKGKKEERSSFLKKRSKRLFSV
jgi:hypothetical protein